MTQRHEHSDTSTKERDMSLRIVRLGYTRKRNEGLRLGTVRRPPRGVRKADYASADYFDLWLPDLAPRAGLLAASGGMPIADERWPRFATRYRAEMKRPEKQRLLALLAAMSKNTNFSVGCYCEREERCHRSILKE